MILRKLKIYIYKKELIDDFLVAVVQQFILTTSVDIER